MPYYKSDKFTNVHSSMKQTSKRHKLTQTTWVLGDTNTKKYGLLWCDKTPKGKRNKPAKINGIQHHEIAPASRSEISSSVEHVYYQPVQ